MNFEKIKPQLRHGFYFMFAGPLVGLGIILSLLMVATLINDGYSGLSNLSVDIIGRLILLFFISLLVAYLVGAIPAFITGLISGIGKNKTEEIIFSIAGGAATCFLLSIFFIPEMSFFLTASALGAISGLVCVLLKHKRIKYKR